MILSVAAVVLFVRKGGPRSIGIPIYAAAIFTVGGLLLTLKAAPIMLSVRHLGDDPVSLRRALDGFEFWGGWRSVSQILGFVANLFSLAAIARLSQTQVSSSARP